MLELLNALDDHYVVFLTTLIVGTIVVTSVFRTASAILTSLSKERTRREIAAYIAEGSISAEQGERLLRVEIDSASNRRC
jgi:hypothetical protein